MSGDRCADCGRLEQLAESYRLDGLADHIENGKLRTEIADRADAEEKNTALIGELLDKEKALRAEVEALREALRRVNELVLEWVTMDIVKYPHAINEARSRITGHVNAALTALRSAPPGAP